MIDSTIEGRIKVLRMNHGPANAMDLPFLTAVAEAFIPDDNFDGAVLTGNGRFFSAGLNIVSLTEGNDDNAWNVIETLGRAFMSIMTFPGPVVAVVDGHAVAGGCLLAMSCDHRIGVPGDYKMGLNELALGLDLPAIALVAVRRCVPANRQFEVTSLSQFYSPEEAVALGILNEINNDAETEALKMSTSLADSLAPFQRLKKNLNAPALEMFEKGGDSTDEFIRQWKTPESQAKIKAAVEKMKKS
ncbi:MAG TPA: enoyl-CoA hydratase/isomerase family protein [Candidatus Marinimicrobia bacterium]|jgi:enoyl-CoA hydratase|nr:enoyl-CoA hydratase/isomerase family protein [Candidatus Neomarinimicrobiota bacterium]HHZ99954.1 enoyl-CoA hydratase/isomerase family protein [Candidatus Neomarinimicrobiota bacterium]HIB03376.1 enoyl-CoA hydratase/isomerase family protein [Candidatus Neomarinimicrobiota bacterium]HIB71723.1 enoyl-CoA hydratase/isomerase family protein [Candidatus Neomarinimicrobiota bacterium]HIB95841.1 enoyl-CoA hydratase/isomerase family protein [Candidatus Neomarinimicrobiota bacterium]